QPAAPLHRAALADLAGAMGRYDRLAAVLESAADASQDRDLAAALLIDAARVARDRLGDRDRALAVFTRALGLAADGAGALGIARELDPLLEASGQAAERADLIERMIRLERDPASLAALTRELAEVASRDLW